MENLNGLLIETCKLDENFVQALKAGLSTKKIKRNNDLILGIAVSRPKYNIFLNIIYQKSFIESYSSKTIHQTSSIQNYLPKSCSLKVIYQVVFSVFLTQALRLLNIVTTIRFYSNHLSNHLAGPNL